eukprot:5902392-Karenia_brevis.AAC.1
MNMVTGSDRVENSNWPKRLKITDLLCEHRAKTSKISASKKKKKQKKKKKKKKAGAAATPAPLLSGVGAVDKIADDVLHHLDLQKVDEQ